MQKVVIFQSDAELLLADSALLRFRRMQHAQVLKGGASTTQWRAELATAIQR